MILTKLALADRAGRRPIDQCALNFEELNFTHDVELQKFVDCAKAAGVWNKMEPPVLQGRDLLDVVKPGPQLGKMLQAAYLIQLEEGIVDKAILKKRVMI